MTATRDGLFQRAIDRRKFGVELGPDALDGADDRQRDTARNQAILDGGSAGLIALEPGKQPTHSKLPLTRDPALPRQFFYVRLFHTRASEGIPAGAGCRRVDQHAKRAVKVETGFYHYTPIPRALPVPFAVNQMAGSVVIRRRKFTSGFASASHHGRSGIPAE